MTPQFQAAVGYTGSRFLQRAGDRLKAWPSPTFSASPSLLPGNKGKMSLFLSPQSPCHPQPNLKVETTYPKVPSAQCSLCISWDSHPSQLSQRCCLQSLRKWLTLANLTSQARGTEVCSGMLSPPETWSTPFILPLDYLLIPAPWHSI